MRPHEVAIQHHPRAHGHAHPGRIQGRLRVRMERDEALPRDGRPGRAGAPARQRKEVALMSGYKAHSMRVFGGFPRAVSGKIGAQVNGPDNGVCTSGRGLIDAIEERQL